MMPEKIRELWYKVERIIDYIPVLWRDYEWDYNGFYRLLEKRLERTEKHFREDGLAVSAEKDADNMRIARMLCNRLGNEDYLERALIPHRRKWGEIADFRVRETSDGLLEHLGAVWEKVQTEEEHEQAEKEFRTASARSRYSKQADKEYLFDLLKDNIDHWWD